MNTAQELLILAVQTKTRLRYLGSGLCIFPGDGLPEGALRRFRDAEDELAELVDELFAFELSEAEGEQMGREMYQEFLAREAAELKAKGICPTCRDTGYALDDDGISDEVCTDCHAHTRRSCDDSDSLGDSAPTEELAGEATGVAPAIGGPTSALADPGVDGKPSPTPEDS